MAMAMAKVRGTRQTNATGLVHVLGRVQLLVGWLVDLCAFAHKASWCVHSLYLVPVSQVLGQVWNVWSA